MSLGLNLSLVLPKKFLLGCLAWEWVMGLMVVGVGVVLTYPPPTAGRGP